MADTVLKGENKVGGLTLPKIKTYYKVNSNQDSVVWAKEQTNRSMELNRKPRNRPRHIQSTDFDKGTEAI